MKNLFFAALFIFVLTLGNSSHCMPSENSEICLQECEKIIQGLSEEERLQLVQELLDAGLLQTGKKKLNKCLCLNFLDALLLMLVPIVAVTVLLNKIERFRDDDPKLKESIKIIKASCKRHRGGKQ